MAIEKRTQSKKMRLSLLSGSGVGLIALIAVLLNLLSGTFFFRWDWTANNRYSLSDASVGLLHSLKDTVRVRVYLSEGLPQPYSLHAKYVKDLLREYRVKSRGKLQPVFITPEESEESREAAHRAGVVPVRFTQVDSDQFQVKEGYLGIVFFFQDKQAVIPFVNGTDNLEYDISSRIKLMAQKEKITLGFVNNHREVPSSNLWQTVPDLFDRFDVQDINLSSSTVQSPQALIFLGPKTTLTQREIQRLDDFIVQGVPMAIFLNRRLVDMRNFRSVPLLTGLENLVKHYGLTIRSNFVMDQQSQRISLQSQQGAYTISNIVNYPAIPLADNLHKDHPLTKSLNVLGFPFAHGLSWTMSNRSKITVTPLAHSSPYSWSPEGSKSLDPYTLEEPHEDDPKGPFPLAALVEGSTTSFTDPERSVDNLRLLVVGTGHFIDPSLPAPDDNFRFLVTAAEWLTQDKNLLAIPLKGAPYRPLQKVSDTSRQLAKALGRFFLPFLTIAAGGLYWKRRQSTRRRVQQRYAPPASPDAPSQDEGVPPSPSL